MAAPWLGRELSRARRSSGRVTVGILSMGGPKGAGGQGASPSNATLQLIAKTLVTQLRSFDTVSRYSPWEFALVLPDISGENAEKVIGRALDVIRSGFGEAAIDPCAGLSCYPEDGSTTERLIETAEAALNLAMEERSPVKRWKEE